jgi:hypothetical protein
MAPPMGAAGRPDRATGCLEGMASMTRTVRDVRFSGLMTRYRSGRTGTVATRSGYTRQ